MPRPPVSLLLPNRNNEPILDLTFERLLEHTTYPDFEVVVVDDGSSDGSRKVLRRWRDAGAFRQMTLIERDHAGVAETLNVGLRAASGELVVQLDGDATVETTGWLERMVDFHQSDDRIGVVTPMVVYDDGYLNAAGVNLICPEGLHDRGSHPIEPVGSRTLHGLTQRVTPADAAPLLSRVSEVDTAIGVCMLYPRALAEEIGGYDPGFAPVWFDDLDLALSARRLGMKVFYLPGVEVTHRLSMRNDRRKLSRLEEARQFSRRKVARVAPHSIRAAVGRMERRRATAHRPHELKRLAHHYAYWREKWSFDLCNPDLDFIRAAYGDTEIWWRYDVDRRQEGERIAAAWAACAPADRKGEAGVEAA